ncbi:MAG: DMT family transporter [Pseudomonadales bacterium]
MTPATLKAVLWMCGGLVCFSLLAIASRELTAGLSAVNIMFWRSLIGLAIICAVLAVRRQAIRTNQLRWHLLRNSAHFAGQCAWLFAIAAIPLAEVFALEFTTPLWAAIFASIFLAERLSPSRLLAAACGLVGVLVMLRPGAAAIHPASIVMLAGAVGFGITIVTTRHLGKTDRPIVVLFYMTLMQSCFALILSINHWVWPQDTQWLWLLAAGLTALAAHYCLTKALSLADAAVVIPVDYLRLPLIALLGWIIYDEALSWPIAFGAIFIIGGNALGLYGEHRRTRTKIRINGA